MGLKGKDKSFLLTSYLFACMLVIIVAIFFNRNQREKKRLILERDFINATTILRDKTESFVHGLQGMAGVFRAHDFNPTEAEIRDYALSRQYFNNFPGALGFGFIRRVQKENLVHYQFQKNKNIKNFKVFALEEGLSQEAFVIELIEPYEANLKARGLDIASEKKRRLAAVQAMETGRAVLTESIQLVQSKATEAGFLFLLPVYLSPEIPSTVEMRKKLLVGWAYAPILLSSLVDQMHNLSNQSLRFILSDVTDGSERLLFRDPEMKLNQYRRYEFESTLGVGGRKWKISGLSLRASLYGSTLAASIGLGFILWLLVTAVFLYLSNQISRKGEREDYLETIESWQNSILDSSYFSIISTDPNGLITTFNNAAEKMLGYAARDVVGKFTPAIIHDSNEVIAHAQTLSQQSGSEVAPGFEVFVKQARVNGSETREWTYLHKNGKRIPVRLTVTVMRNKNNAIVGYLGIAEDLTQAKEMQQTIEMHRIQMVSSAKMSALGEMAAGISHEINNPLGILAGSLAILEIQLDQSEEKNKIVSDRVTAMKNNVTRIANIVSGLRTFARDSEKENKVSIAVNDIINDTCNFCRERFKNHQVDLRLVLTDDCKIVCQPSQISQVLLNLLNNSFDAICDLTQKWIQVETQIKAGKVQIIVTDSGDRIDPQVAPKMMEPFFTTKEVGKGTGLGLSISLGIVRSHGGDLTYEAYSQNTKFVVSIPLA